MHMKLNIVMSEEGDWEGLYLDGNLVAQGHSITARDALEAIGHKVDWSEATTAQLEQHGNSLPDNLSELNDAQSR